MTSKYARRLLDHLKHDEYVPARIGELARDLNIPENEKSDFETAVRELSEQKLVIVNLNGTVTLPSIGSMGGRVEGTFRKNARGFGFVSPNTAAKEGSVFIPADCT
ncbi:MAG: hypothetical protein ACK54H_09165, partial [Phycisphaerales bacterium]